MKRLGLTLLLILMAAMPRSFAAKQQAPEGSPTRAIQDLDDLLDAYILHPKTEEEKDRNAELKRKILQGTFDVGELCRLALNLHWNELSAREQTRFVDLMTQLLEKKGIFSKEQGNERSKGSKTLYFVTYEGDRFLNSQKSQALTRTLVRIPSENLKIGLNYKLMKVGEGWKIYDVIVDDASLVDNYKYQFDKIIREHGYEDLVRRMDAKLKELEQKGTPLSPAPPPKSRFGCTLSP